MRELEWMDGVNDMSFENLLKIYEEYAYPKEKWAAFKKAIRNAISEQEKT